MKLYILSPINVPLNPVLFPLFMPIWESMGHQHVKDIREADVVLFDLHTRIGYYDQRDIEWLDKNETFTSTFCEWDRGNLSDDVWPYPLTKQQEQIFEKIDKGQIKSVHFCRLFDPLNAQYEVHPYDKPVSYEEQMCTSDELFNRGYDVCYIANTAPSREEIAKAFREDGRINCHISLGATKMPFNEFVSQHKKAKLFISSGAGGYTDERKQCLFSIAGIIQERTDQLVLHPLTHLDNCLKIDSPPTKQDLDIIFEVVNDKEKLYEIYRSGIDFMKTYYSKEYIATNIIETISKSLS